MELCEKDIESLGFIFLKYENSKIVFINNSIFNRDEKIHFGELYQDKRYIVIENNCGQFYFMGWIKNKEELEIILNQTCVNFENINLK